MARSRDSSGFLFALGHAREEFGLDFGGVVDAGRHALLEQFEQESLFAGRWLAQQRDELLGLFFRQRQGRNAERGAFGGMGTIGF